MRISVLSGASVLVLVVALSTAQPNTAAAQLSAGGRTIGGGGAFKVDCNDDYLADTIFRSTTPIEQLCATIQADGNCRLRVRLMDQLPSAAAFAAGQRARVLAAAVVGFNNTVTLCAEGVGWVTLKREAAGGLATVNWRVDTP